MTSKRTYTTSRPRLTFSANFRANCAVILFRREDIAALPRKTALFRRGTPAHISETPLISNRLARAYAAETKKIIERDLDFLIKAGLAEKTAGGYRVKRKIILAFQPVKAKKKEYQGFRNHSPPAKAPWDHPVPDHRGRNILRAIFRRIK